MSNSVLARSNLIADASWQVHLLLRFGLHLVKLATSYVAYMQWPILNDPLTKIAPTIVSQQV